MYINDGCLNDMAAKEFKEGYNTGYKSALDDVYLKFTREWEYDNSATWHEFLKKICDDLRAWEVEIRG